MIPPIPNRAEYAEALVLAAVAEFDRQGIRVTYGQGSADYVVARMRQAMIHGRLHTHDLAQAVKRLRKAGKLIVVPVGQYSNRTKLFGLRAAQSYAQPCG